jgi:hypothetical protein
MLLVDFSGQRLEVKIADNGFSQICFYLFSALTAPLSPTCRLFTMLKSSEAKYIKYQKLL